VLLPKVSAFTDGGIVANVSSKSTLDNSAMPTESPVLFLATDKPSATEAEAEIPLTPDFDDPLVELLASRSSDTKPVATSYSISTASTVTLTNLSAVFNVDETSSSPEITDDDLAHSSEQRHARQQVIEQSKFLLDRFGSISRIPHSSIIQLVADTCPNQAKSIAVTDMKYGSYNCVYFIKREDGSMVLLRVPAVGRKPLWSETDAHMMTTDFRTARFIKANTSIPMPDMLHYDVSFDNAIEAPHMFISLLSGTQLYEAQEAWKSQEIYNQKNAKVMAQLGAALAQLSKPELQFEEVGMLEFDDDICTNPRVGKTYMESDMDYGHAMHLMSLGNGRQIPAREYTLSSSKMFFTDAYNLNLDYDLTGPELAYQRVVALGLDMIPESKLYPSQKRSPLDFGI
jgi:hypothetical protein